jgi:hypothetical protein
MNVLLSKSVARELYKEVSSKLSPQYKLSNKPNYRFTAGGKKAKEELQKAFGIIVLQAVQLTVARTEDNVSAAYNHYIPVPTANLKTRLKFLITGKLA